MYFAGWTVSEAAKCNSADCCLRRWSLANRASRRFHLCSYEKQTQTDGIDYRSLQRYWARINKGISGCGFQRSCELAPCRGKGNRVLHTKEKKMSEHFHDSGDLRFLKEMGKLAPTEFNAWLSLDKIVGREDGAIPRKYRELIALGVAFTTQCPYCIEAHVKGAKAAGASREEITESSLIAAALRAGGAATHGAMALKFYDQT